MVAMRAQLVSALAEKQFAAMAHAARVAHLELCVRL